MVGSIDTELLTRLLGQGLATAEDQMIVEVVKCEGATISEKILNYQEGEGCQKSGIDFSDIYCTGNPYDLADRIYDYTRLREDVFQKGGIWRGFDQECAVIRVSEDREERIDTAFDHDTIEQLEYCRDEESLYRLLEIAKVAGGRSVNGILEAMHRIDAEGFNNVLIDLLENYDDDRVKKYTIELMRERVDYPGREKLKYGLRGFLQGGKTGSIELIAEGVRTLGKFGDPSDIGYFKMMASFSQESTISLSAIHALGNIHTDKSFDYLWGIVLSSFEPFEQREAAVEALSNFGVGGGFFLRELIRGIIEKDEKYLPLMQAAVGALVKVDYGSEVGRFREADIYQLEKLLDQYSGYELEIILKAISDIDIIDIPDKVDMYRRLYERFENKLVAKEIIVKGILKDCPDELTDLLTLYLYDINTPDFGQLISRIATIKKDVIDVLSTREGDGITEALYRCAVDYHPQSSINKAATAALRGRIEKEEAKRLIVEDRDGRKVNRAILAEEFNLEITGTLYLQTVYDCFKSENNPYFGDAKLATDRLIYHKERDKLLDIVIKRYTDLDDISWRATRLASQAFKGLIDLKAVEELKVIAENKDLPDRLRLKASEAISELNK